jgi:hypothetical protein
MLHTALALLIASSPISPQPQSAPQGSTDPIGPGLQDPSPQNDIAQLVSALRGVRAFASELSELSPNEFPEPTKAFCDRDNRATLTLRAAGRARFPETRQVLLEIVDACEHSVTELIALEAMAALRMLGEPQSYFEDLILRARESPYRAASAMYIAAWTPSDELVALCKRMRLSYPRENDPDRVFALLGRAVGEVEGANSTRKRVEALIRDGKRAEADRCLLSQFWRSYSPPQKKGDTPMLGWRVHWPSAAYARSLLNVRASQDPDGLLAALDSMTLQDFLQRSPEEPLPEDHVERTALFRAQLLTMLPEALRNKAGSGKFGR